MLNLISAQTCGFGCVRELEVFDAIRRRQEEAVEIAELVRLSEIIETGFLGEIVLENPTPKRRKRFWLI